MCTAIKTTLKTAFETLGATLATAAKEAGKQVFNGYNWAGRRVEKLAYDTLPETAAKVVASAVWALPYTAAGLIAPSFVYDIAATITIGAWHVAGRPIDESIGKEHRQHIYTGLRNASIIRIGICAASMAVTGNWHLLLPIIQHLFIAAQSNSIVLADTPAEKQAQEATK
jgi:hypothetical protein